MIKYPIHTDDLMVKLLLFFPATTLLQGFPAFGWINKCIVVVIFFALAWDIKKDRGAVLAAILCGMLSICAVLFSNRSYLNLQDIFYFPLYVLYCTYWIKNSKSFGITFQKNISFAIVSALIWGILVGISAFLPSSYSINTDMNTVYFRSFTNSPFRVASTCVTIMLILHSLAYYKNPCIFLLEVLPMAVILAAGARVYLLVGVGILLLSLYLLCKHKRSFLIYLIPILVVTAVIVLNSSIMDKLFQVKYAQEELGITYLDAFTSGRTIFWRCDLDAFKELSIWRQLIGNGLSFAYEVNATKYGIAIWAHNDFISILLSYGWVGLALYSYCFLWIAGKFRKTYGLSWLTFLGAIGITLGNAFINGLYLYTVVMLATPFLFYTMSLDKAKQ